MLGTRLAINLCKALSEIWEYVAACRQRFWEPSFRLLDLWVGTYRD